MDFEEDNYRVEAAGLRPDRQKVKRPAISFRKDGAEPTFQDAELVQHYPAHLRGPSQNRHGGHQMCKMRGFNGAEYKDYGPGRVLDGDEKQRVIDEMRGRGEID